MTKNKELLVFWAVVIFLSLGVFLRAGCYLCQREERSIMARGYPDWTNAVVLTAEDPDGNMVIVVVDSDGRLTVPFKGINPDLDLMTVAVDADGQLFAIMKGSDGNILTVDTNGYMTAILKGVNPSAELMTLAVDANGQIMAIMKGSDGNILAVDTDGYMTAILKGDYGGELRTIGLDDEGRISGYLVDAEDQWGQTLKVGSAELAARLGSPVSWDRRGQVQHLVDFSLGKHGLTFNAWPSPSDVTLNPQYWQSGGYSALLHTSAAANCYARVIGHQSGAPSDRYGLSVTWSSQDSPDWLYLSLEHDKGTVEQKARLKFDDGAEALYYYDSDKVWQKIADVPLKASQTAWHNMKLVADFDTGKYVRALVDSVEYPLNYDVQASTIPASAEGLYYIFYVDGYDAITTDTYLDKMIFTVNEP